MAGGPTQAKRWLEWGTDQTLIITHNYPLTS